MPAPNQPKRAKSTGNHDEIAPSPSETLPDMSTAPEMLLDGLCQHLALSSHRADDQWWRNGLEEHQHDTIKAGLVQTRPITV